MLLTIPPKRISDKWGYGHYLAPRGDHKHKGQDFACYPNSEIKAIKYGQVTKIGFPYDDDEDQDGRPDFTYVEIEDPMQNRAQYYYVEPSVKVGDMIQSGQTIGYTQALGGKYNEITEHLHLQVKDKHGVYFDPNTYLIPMARP
jgi:murein DD-endopeptidase MepM/ murein hydrolase activator NlpD